MINPKYHPYLSQLFSAPVILELASKGKSVLFSSVLKDSGFASTLRKTATWGDVFKKAYNFLLKRYRSEYVFKNIITNRLMLERYGFDEASLLTEFRVDNVKSDILILNGSSYAYEIKTELDNLDRLASQIAAYLKTFDYVSVVASESYAEKIKGVIPARVGLLMLDAEGNLQELVKAKSNKCNANPESIFNSFRKDEHCEILRKNSIDPASIPRGKLYSKAKKVFCQYSPAEAHDLMVRLIKSRASSIKLEAFVKKVPNALKFAAFSTSLNAPQKERFADLLATSFLS